MSYEEPIEAVIARSSLGGAAWCSICKHPDLVHEDSGCFGISSLAAEQPDCMCQRFVPMTPDEWLRRKP